MNILPGGQGVKTDTTKAEGSRESGNGETPSSETQDPCLPISAPTLPVPSTRNANISYTDPTILYRYPPYADPPPAEVCDFCLPAGGRLRHLSKPADREQSTLEMLYGHGQSQRSSRCFIFILEDKTLDPTKQVPNEETGENTGR